MEAMVIGFIFLLIGLIYRLLQPKKINWLYGWRTGFAMKNQNTWKEANKFGAVLFIYGGIFLMISAFLSGALLKYKGKYIFMPLVLITMVAIITIGEVRLRKIFDKDGNRKI